MVMFGRLPRFIIALCVTTLFTAGCNKDGGKASEEWYFEGNAPLFTEDRFPTGREDVVYFSDDGQWSPYHVWVSSCYEGDGMHIIQLPLPIEPEFIQIVDEQSLIHYYGLIYRYGAPGAQGRKLLYQFNNKNYGKMAVYEGSSSYHVYTREGKNIVIRQGDQKQIFTVVDGALMMDGGGRWTKYDPNTVF